MMQYHIGLKPGDIGKIVLLPGSPGRVKKMAQYLEKPRFVASNREYTTWAGTYKGIKIAIMSTGIGGPSAAIALEELINIGADTFIRTGTCGSLQPQIKRGDCVIATAAVRGSGTTNAYVPTEYPAVADPDLVSALTASAQMAYVDFHRGIVHCKDAFFLEDPPKLPLQNCADEYWKVLENANVLASEMESDTLFVIGSVRKVRVASLLISLGGKVENNQITGITDEMLQTLTTIPLNAIAYLRN